MPLNPRVCACQPRLAGQAIRNFDDLATLATHTCFELIQIKATLIYFQFRAAPATKTIPSAIQLKVSPNTLKSDVEILPKS